MWWRRLATTRQCGIKGVHSVCSILRGKCELDQRCPYRTTSAWLPTYCTWHVQTPPAPAAGSSVLLLKLAVEHLAKVWLLPCFFPFDFSQ